eukprot:GEMP01042618.1.p1 GENE.GEMP01042618.1~~GEMP01042618.1.p1  ORF type:complete len:312 (+),score=57.36 GEMP01042618.1:165-1100(+)
MFADDPFLTKPDYGATALGTTVPERRATGLQGAAPRFNQRQNIWWKMLSDAWPIVAIELGFVVAIWMWAAVTPWSLPYYDVSIFLLLLVVCVLTALHHRTWGLLAVALVLGTLFGYHYYCTHFYQVWSYDEQARYADVLATSPAKSRLDAGRISFAKTTHVDTTRPIGYKHGEVYCVAPIIDDSPSLDETINYWAVGLNCCGARDAFECHDAINPEAHGGMVVATTKESEFHTDPLDMYRKAAEVAAGHFEMSQSPNAIFVYWVKDMDVYRSTIIADANVSFLSASVFFLMLLLPMYIFMSLIASRTKKWH